MTLWDELYFEITVHGVKSELRKFANFLLSGELDEFFEITDDYLIYDDAYSSAEDTAESEIIFSNDDYGIEINEFDTDEFLEIFCKAAKKLDVWGTLCDADGTEFHFSSALGDSYYVNSRDSVVFNDELDAVAMDEEKDEE